MIKNLQVFGVAGVLLLSSVAHAAAVTARLDRSNAVVGETVTLILQTDDTDQSLDTDLAALESDFDILDRRSETQMSFVNGRKTAYVRLVITLEPKRAGNLRIPALKFPGASSAPLTLKVSAAPALATGDPEPVFIEVTVLPDAGPYYVLSQVGLVVRIFYQVNLTEAAINPPAPVQASVRLLDEVPYQAERNGAEYRVLERRYAIFPERSGTLTIPPMQLSGRLIERPSDRLWQPTVRGRRVRVASEPLNLEISPRPDEFTGNSWLPARRITLSQKISDNETLRVGEPVTRTVIVDAVGLEENMLEEPVWPDMPDTRIYPDQPQGISRDDGEWVLGHKEFRYAIVPENAGELVLPEIRLDWWDTVTNRQRTAVLPEHRLTVLPSKLSPAVTVLPPATDIVSGSGISTSGGQAGATGNAMLWKTATGVLALVWLLTLYFYYRRDSAVSLQAGTNDSVSLAEKALLKQFQKACQKNDASLARKDLAQWIRNYSPQPMRGSMRDFGAACGDQTLQQSIAELDASGFTGDGIVAWQGAALWAAFKTWQNQAASPGKSEIGDSPDLYGQ
ncbi:MAG: BatD family protein [Gammaproteobacteria bacterium]|nr:MAG: BatD family protein [Gammaproteobacteria bacterium]